MDGTKDDLIRGDERTGQPEAEGVDAVVVIATDFPQTDVVAER